MKYYDSTGHNARIVRMVMKELNVEIDTEVIDIMTHQSRSPEYLKINPEGQCPALVLDNGLVLSESTVIAKYIDEKLGNSKLMGSNDYDKYQTQNWLRALDIKFVAPFTFSLQSGELNAVYKSKFPTFPENLNIFKEIYQFKLKSLDKRLNNQQFICGDRFSLADIVLYCFVALGEELGRSYKEYLPNVMGICARVSERESAKTTTNVI